jgi:hypothetical protein
MYDKYGMKGKEKSKSFVNIEVGVDGVLKGLTLAGKMARLVAECLGELWPAAASIGRLWLAAGHLWLATPSCWMAAAS